MPASAVRKSAKAPVPEARPVVRAAKPIPVLKRTAPAPEPIESETEAKVSLCKGRCGHCDLHPCQLHPTV